MDKTLIGIFKEKNRKLLLSGILVFNILIDLLIMGCEVGGIYDSVWAVVSVGFIGLDMLFAMGMVLIVLFLANTVVSIAGIVSALMNNRIPIYPYAIGLMVHIIMLTISSVFELFDFIGGFWIVLYILLAIAGLAYAILCVVIAGHKKKRSAGKVSSGQRRVLILVLGVISLVLTFMLFFMPFFSYTVSEQEYTVIPVGIFTAEYNVVINLVVFVALFAACAVSFMAFLSSFKSYSTSEAEYAGKMQSVLALNALITGGYYVGGLIWASVRNSKGGDYTASSFLPFLLIAILAVIYAFIIKDIDFAMDGIYERTAKGARIEFFIYGMLVSIVTVAASMSDILQVVFTEPANTDPVRLNGFKVLTTYNSMDAGFQMGAFFLIAILAITVALFLSSVVSFISKSKLFYKITLAQILAGAMSTMILGLFGKYYEIVQKMNMDALAAWIGRFIEVGEFDIVYKVKSQAFYWFLGVMAIIVIVLLRKPYTRGIMAEALVPVGGPRTSFGSESYLQTTDPLAGTKDPTAKGDVDPCPAFTELDSKAAYFRDEQDRVTDFEYESPTLPDLVQFVVNYARDSRLHLSYTPEDIAAFIAGLGASRLTILQGMSGTGKTSLPKIFTEAVFGNCELIEVESSWRDKNELLGYYNEFSRTYTPKKFTQALYKAKLNPDRLTFIVLDEMNLSRVEYYFSDFLSLMEHEEEKRQIKLLNVGLYRIENSIRRPYLALTDGHTLKIPSNVWFVGTANRDESTFEISDKVYDRAHTMNFNKRAPKLLYQHDPIPQRYLAVDELLALFEGAKKTVKFDLDSSAVVGEVEELLAPYNISFGNRVANQIETFVSIYCACFAPSEAVMHQALETILLSKVVSKLEFRSVDDKERLAAEFARLRLNKCSEFIRKLHED